MRAKSMGNSTNWGKIVSKKIGLLGGTFDPIHLGHLNLAFELMEKRKLDEVWFIPAFVSPFKQNHPSQASIEQRLAMLQLALEDIPQFKINTIECQRAPPSYTIDTIQTLIAQDKASAQDSQFFLMMGEDAVGLFPQWHQAEEIVPLIPLIIGSRVTELPEDFLKCSEAIWQAFQKGLTLTCLFDVSSTDIRERVAQKLYCGHLLPATVYSYIKKNNLYCSSQNETISL
jgi:nicotinate-nucleotide adenylyltransferase